MCIKHAKMHNMGNLEAKKDWGDLQTVLALVRHGTLAKAAEELNVNYTTIARRVAQAESRYNVPLFERLPQGYVPTEAAFAAAKHAELMEQAEANFRITLGGMDKGLQGKLVVTAPQLLVSTHLCSVFAEFTNQHPEVDLTIMAGNEVLNLNQREADVAVRISNNPGDNLIGTRLAEQDTAAFASPELAGSIRDNPDMPFDWIGFTYWTTPPKATLDRYPNARIRFRFDDMAAAISAAQAGLGVLRAPVFVGEHSGLHLVPIMEAQPYSDIWIVAHRELWNSTKVTAFRTCVAAYFKDNRGKFVMRRHR